MKQSPCGLNIEKYLAGQFTPNEETDFESHLDHCSSCRQQLQLSAADPKSWGEARHYLRTLLSGQSVAANGVGRELSPPSDNFVAEALGDEKAVWQQVLKLLAPTDDPEMLGRVGCYEISGVIGAGGMGIVLKGWDRPLGRAVAIKLMSPHLACSGVARARFLREAQAAASIVHPNVIDIYGVDQLDSLPYLVMPFIRGKSLDKRVQAQGALPVEDVLRIGWQIASGLSAAHAQGIIHRDIKPANILVGDGIDRVIITDFGLARTVDDASLTRSGTVAGTPQFMSPEQAKGEHVAESSDLFSLGSVLYYLCTGHPPFRAESIYGTLQKIATAQSRDMREIQSSVPVWLQRLVRRLHATSPEQRYESAAVVAKLLEQCLAHYQQPLTHRLPKELAEPECPRPASAQTRIVQLVIAIAVSIALIPLAGWMVARWPGSSLSNQPTSQASIAPLPLSKKTVPFETTLSEKSEQLKLALRSARTEYRFHPAKPTGYLLRLNLAETLRPVRQVYGVIILKPFAIDENRIELAVSTLLESETIDESFQKTDESTRANFNGTQRSTGFETLTTVVIIDAEGKRLDNQRELQLPCELGSPLKYVLPELSLASVPQFKPGNRKLTLKGDNGGEFLFDLDEGQVEKFQWDGWWPTDSQSQSAGTQFILEVEKLSESEVNEWTELESPLDMHQKAPIKLSVRELAKCTAELASDEKVLFWLRKLNYDRVEQFPEELRSELRNYSEHRYPLYRSLSQRILNRLPIEPEDPFELIE